MASPSELVSIYFLGRFIQLLLHVIYVPIVYALNASLFFLPCIDSFLALIDLLIKRVVSAVIGHQVIPLSISRIETSHNVLVLERGGLHVMWLSELLINMASVELPFLIVTVKYFSSLLDWAKFRWKHRRRWHRWTKLLLPHCTLVKAMECGRELVLLVLLRWCIHHIYHVDVASISATVSV